MNTPALQKVTLALVTEESTRHFITDADRLGFPADSIPESLETDLGTNWPLYYCGLDADGTAIYRQNPRANKAVTLRVRNADPDGREGTRTKAIDALLAELIGLTETSAKVRAELADKITRNDETALCALIHMHSAPESIQKAKHAQAVLSLLQQAPAHERIAELRRYVKQADAWLDAWRPNLESHPLRTVFNAAEYEAVKELRQIVLAAIEPSVKAK